MNGKKLGKGVFLIPEPKEKEFVGDIDEHEARIALAAELYREGKMTLKQAADTAKLTLWDFLYELG